MKKGEHFIISLLTIKTLNLENIDMNIQELVRNLKLEEEMTLVHKQ